MPVLEEQNTFVADFEQAESALSRVGSPALHRLRHAAIERFAALGFPTLDDEEWRFTPLAALNATTFQPGGAVAVDAAVVGPLAFVAEDSHCLVFVNGQFTPALSSHRALPQGVIFASIADALKDHRDKVEPHLAQLADYEDYVFTALNTA